MAQRWWLHNNEQLDNFIEHIRAEWIAGRKPTVQFVATARTTEQNGMLHELIREIAAQKDDETEIEIKRHIKLHLGVPILRASNPEFGEKYDRVIKETLSYEQKLLAMDILPVTSIMDKKQFARLLDSVITHYQAQGVELRPHG